MSERSIIDRHLEMVKMGLRKSNKVDLSAFPDPPNPLWVSPYIYKRDYPYCRQKIFYQFILNGRYIKGSTDLKKVEVFRDFYFKTWCRRGGIR